MEEIKIPKHLMQLKRSVCARAGARGKRIAYIGGSNVQRHSGKKY